MEVLLRSKDEKPLDSNEPIKIDLDAEDALRSLLKVDPEAKPVDEDTAPPHGDPRSDSKG